MTLAPLMNASPTIQAHAIVALIALALGTLQMLAPKGTMNHRSVGWGWAMAMMFVAGSSLFIHEIKSFGIWSPIHLLSLLTLVTVPLAVRRAKHHQVERHRRAMIAIFALALVVTGLFTLAPGRIMHAVVFGG